MDIKDKVNLYLQEIKNGRFEVRNNLIVYKKVDRYASYVGVKIGDIIGRKRPDAKSWQCYATINGKPIIIAMSIVMYAYHYGIESIYEKMEIRYRDCNRYNFSKENMIDASYRFGITDDELKESILKRIELFLKQLEVGLYYVDEKSGTIYYNATGMNVKKGDKLGYIDDVGYLEYAFNLRGRKTRCYSVRLHQLLYAYYNGISNFDESKVIHHMNENKLDNRKENLEQISHCNNARLSQISNIDNIKNQLSSNEKVQFVLNRINKGIYRINVELGEIYYAQKIPHVRLEIGGEVGSISNKGYRIISFRIDGIIYNVALHVVVYYFVHGIRNFDENAVIDHIDGDKLNNSIINLQKISHRNNSKKGSRL